LDTDLGPDNWKFGRVNINILVLGIAHNGIAFPILWSLLPKAGNSNTAERVALLERFLSIFGCDKINYLVADREFVGKQWFDFLHQKNIPFRIRIKKDTLIKNSHGLNVPAWTLFRNLKEQCHVLSTKRDVWRHQLYVLGSKLSNG
jgi:hypothetical protein